MLIFFSFSFFLREQRAPRERAPSSELRLEGKGVKRTRETVVPFCEVENVSGKEVKKMVCKCRNNMFLSLCHPYVSQSRWRLVFLTPEKYSNSQISVKDWIDIRCRIEQENLLSSYRKLLRNESYVIVEDYFIHVFHSFWKIIQKSRKWFRKVRK